MATKIIFSEWDKSLEVKPKHIIHVLKKTQYARSVKFKVDRSSNKVQKINKQNEPLEDFDIDSDYRILSGSLSTRKNHYDYRYKISSLVGTLVAGSGGCARSSYHYVVKVENGKYILRLLTPEECEQLQGWPIGHTEIGINGALSRKQRYDIIGNGISSIVAKELLEELTSGKGGNLVSFFTGGGGTELLLDKDRYPIDAYFEIKKHAVSLLAHLYPDTPNVGNVMNIDTYTPLRPVSIITGGFPCQSYSYVGSRKGLKDKRGEIFYALAYALLKLSPEYALFENVEGILTIDSGATVEHLCLVMQGLGYEVEVRKCKSSDFGLRQARGRVFFLLKKNREQNSQTVDFVKEQFFNLKQKSYPEIALDLSA